VVLSADCKDAAEDEAATTVRATTDDASRRTGPRAVVAYTVLVGTFRFWATVPRMPTRLTLALSTPLRMSVLDK